jgi:hypothetical protein
MTSWNSMLVGPMCYHTRPTKLYVLSFCTLTSLSFVLSLYVLVPPSIRQLSRNDPKQIRWRLFATTVSTLLSSLLIYPLLFCNGTTNHKNNSNSIIDSAFLYSYICWVPSSKIMTVLFHTIKLFLGPLTLLVLSIPLETYCWINTMRQRGLVHNARHFQNKSYIYSFFHTMWSNVIIPKIWIIQVRCFKTSTYQGAGGGRVGLIRNYFIAPLIEEIVFRGLYCSPLLSCGYSPTHVTFIAPLFFGIAHIHHATTQIRKYQQHQQHLSRGNHDSSLDKTVVWNIVCSTLFQCAYTTLFGMYATYILLRTRSVIPVTVSHIFCNIMGLPDLTFMRRPELTKANHDNEREEHYYYRITGDIVTSQQSLLYHYRYALLSVHFIGIYLFIQGFSNNGVLFFNGGGLLELF